MASVICPYCDSSDLKVNHRFCIDGTQREHEPLVISRLRRAIELEKRMTEYEMMEKKQQKEAREKEIREGKKYGRDFYKYSPEDVKDITDVAFLRELRFGVTPAGQPTNEFEWESLHSFHNVINKRIDELEK